MATGGANGEYHDAAGSEPASAGGLAPPEIRMPAAWTLAALVAGLTLGFVLAERGGGDAVLAVLGPVGTLWLRALQVTIVPLVAALLVNGILQMVKAAGAGRMAALTLGTFAVVLFAGAVLSAVAMPALLSAFPVPGEAAQALARQMAGAEPGPVPSLGDLIGSLVPVNIVAAAAETAILPLVVFFAVFAMALTRLAAVQQDIIAGFFAALGNAMLVMIGWVLKLAPVGVFALGTALGATSGADAIGLLAHYVALVVAVGGAIFLAAYAVAVVGARVSLPAFARAILPAQAVALSTQSSLASLPAMLSATRQLGVREEASDFVLPMAVAIFRATSPAMNLAVAIYVAALFDVPLSPPVIAAGLAVSMLTTLGSVSLPGAISFVASIGPIALTMGVPIEPLALLVAVEVVPDLMRTLANVTMDVAVAATVGRRSRPAER
ncbi:cation:dicarboxylase symporter family transporter [uncultured Croceicoccus sp.]|uniref:dicarboxylate/amino acid:cation symporter n=1 Tax=uncultured Croceicoccus sp. TaxID=1295329 RepID=UPI002627D0D6|nr:cation:dicarboxylase symporter family transporter [uncultured Croceicoccus sp.]